MNKKGIIVLIIAIVVIIIAGIGFAIYNKNNNAEENNSNIGNAKNENTELASNTNGTNKDNQEDNNTNTSSSGNKTLVVYYSAQTHTKSVAEKIAKNLNAHIFEIVPQEVYTSNDLDWTDNQSRVSKEHDDESLRNVELVTTKVENWEIYDTILIGYPIWWRNCSMASR